MEKGKVYTSPLFVVRILVNKEKVAGRMEKGGIKNKKVIIATVAPKKVAPTAVLRNKLRRQIYEAVSPLIPSLIPSTSIIIFAKNETIKADFKDMTPDLKNLFVKAKISV